MRRYLAVAAIAVGLLILVCELAFVAMAVPEAGCRTCHTPSEAARELSGTAHRDRTCWSCHKLAGVDGLLRYNLQAADHLVSWVARRQVSPPDGAVVSSRCRACHRGLDAKVMVVRSIRMSHKEISGSGLESVGVGASGVERLPCTQCHRDVAHVFAVGSGAVLDGHSLCVGCHNGAIAGSQCSTCHSGASATSLAGKPSRDPHPASWSKAHGMGDSATCLICHKGSSCRECHGVDLPHERATFIYTHGQQAKGGTAACLACHQQKACDECHEVPLPHPTGYLPAHSEDAKARGNDVCYRCHTESGCMACHVKHIHPGVPKAVRDKVAAQARRASGSTGEGSTP
ncbi:MAG: hypothetical protein M1337_06250 [Actinobacteria bacterium]|nr:hypothetical protein [Actinomycetota bacterium]